MSSSLVCVVYGLPAYREDGSQTPNDQTPEDGRLCADGPAHVLAGLVEEGHRCHGVGWSSWVGVVRSMPVARADGAPMSQWTCWVPEVSTRARV
jgi:hypothetical protein